jgi:hypothetical protein
VREVLYRQIIEPGGISTRHQTAPNTAQTYLNWHATMCSQPAQGHHTQLEALMHQHP